MTTTTSIDNQTKSTPERFQSFSEFYAFYLQEHSNRSCRRLHFVGTAASLVCAGCAVFTLNPVWIAAGVFCGYACAWAGHFFFERNKPAAWQYFAWSFAGDWLMFSQIVRGKIAF